MKTITKDEWNGFTLEKRRAFTGIVKWDEGSIQYWKNGLYHRDEGQGPQYEKPDGHKEYYVSGKPHRLDGPAIIWPDGKEEYFINGKYYTSKLEWLKQTPMFKDFMEYKKL